MRGGGLLRICYFHVCRAVGRFENPGGRGGSNLVGIISPTLIGIMATFLRNLGGGEVPKVLQYVLPTPGRNKTGHCAPGMLQKAGHILKKMTNERNHSSQLFNLK